MTSASPPTDPVTYPGGELQHERADGVSIRGSPIGRRAAESVSGLREPALGEREHLRGGDLEDECGAAVCMTEHAAFDGEVPVALVLAAPEVRESAQPGAVGDLHGVASTTTSRPSFHRLHPVVSVT
jgi:hypothetical protein